MTMGRLSFLSVVGLGVVLLLATVGLARAAERTVKASVVPAAVHEAVKNRYPAARAVGYTREIEKGKITYEVTLRLGGHIADVGVTPEGKILVEEERIAADELPIAVRKALAASPLGRGHIRRVERVVEAGNTLDPRFEIVVQHGSNSVELAFDAIGNLVRYEDAGRPPSGGPRTRPTQAIPAD